MSSGTYCVIRDLGLVKGGKGMRHHEVLVTFSVRAFCRWMADVGREAVRAKKRSAWLEPLPEPVSENASQAVAVSPLRRLPRQQPVLGE
jgi:hypothetical protein